MVRLEFSIELAYEVLDDACEFVFNFHPAITQCRHLERDQSQPGKNLRNGRGAKL